MVVLLYLCRHSFVKDLYFSGDLLQNKPDLSHASLVDAFVENKGGAFVNTLLFNRLHFKLFE